MALPAQVLPGDVIGHYQILGEVGAGGMGVVFKAYDTKLQRTVALKFLSRSLPANWSDRNRLLHEARAASALDHKNIASIHSVEETDDGQLFLVMAYYTGISLASRMRGPRFSPEGAVVILRQIAEGLAHAHVHNLVHRDIKPSNVILTPEGEAKIVDFGLARFVDAAASTQTLSMAGTLSYMSPEQLSGKAVDARTDLWSLGVIAYELLTSRLPFEGDSPAATISAILQAEPPVMGNTPQALQKIVLRLLSKKVEDRYQSCNELLRDFRLAGCGETHGAGTDGWILAKGGVAEKPDFHALRPLSLVRNRRKLVLTVVAVLAVLGGVFLTKRGYWLETTRTDLSSSANPAAYESYLRGLEHLQRYDQPSRLNEAIRLFEATTKTDPKFALAFSALAEAYWDKYRQSDDPHWIELATAACQRAAQLNSQLPAVYVTLGRIHGGTGRHDLAFQEFQRALELDHRNVQALAGLADTYASVGRVTEAEDTYKKASAMCPEDWQGYYRLGAFYYQQNRFNDAASQFRRVIELLPDHAQAHTSLGTALMSLGRDAEAETEFKQALSLAPDYSSFTNLGVLYYNQKRFPEAAAMLERALQLNDKDYLLWNNLAVAYEWLGEQEKARNAFGRELAVLEQVLPVRGDDPQVRASLAIVYSQRHMRKKALSHMEAALALSPNDPDVLNKAGEVYENLGERQSAIEYFEKALRQGLTLEDMAMNPDVRSLLSDPKAQRLLKKAALSAASQKPSAKR